TAKLVALTRNAPCLAHAKRKPRRSGVCRLCPDIHVQTAILAELQHFRAGGLRFLRDVLGAQISQWQISAIAPIGSTPCKPKPTRKPSNRLFAFIL
ncbi:MAG TPA: hypothetical protein PK873_17100, partial [Pseudomonas sp.]|uniref:hypothetical protein n=1 Tax=Pseudomonas sp. TaxID=306 RepID=UPI002CC84AEC